MPSEDSNFCPSCGSPTESNIDNETNKSNVSQQNESERKPQKFSKTRSGGTGKIIGGVFLILIGIGIGGFGLWGYGIQNNNLQVCSSIEGTLG